MLIDYPGHLTAALVVAATLAATLLALRYTLRHGATTRRILSLTLALLPLLTLLLILCNPARVENVPAVARHTSPPLPAPATVTPNEKPLRVLLYSQVLNVDIAAVRRALRHDARVQVDAKLDVFADPAFPNGHEDFSPLTSAELSHYDVVILGPFALAGLDENFSSALYDLVSRQGRAVIFLPGREYFDILTYPDDHLAALLPVTTSDGFAAPASGPGRFQPTPLAVHHRFFANPNWPEDSAAMCAFHQNIRPKPAAQTFASADATPMLVMQRIGAGRTCLVNCRTLHRWYQRDQRGGPLARLLADTLSYLVPTVSEHSPPPPPASPPPVTARPPCIEELWRHPAVLLILCTLLGCQWLYRRLKGAS